MGLSPKLASRCSAEPEWKGSVIEKESDESDGMLIGQAGFGSVGQALLAEAWELEKYVGHCGTVSMSHVMCHFPV